MKELETVSSHLKTSLSLLFFKPKRKIETFDMVSKINKSKKKIKIKIGKHLSLLPNTSPFVFFVVVVDVFLGYPSRNYVTTFIFSPLFNYYSVYLAYKNMREQRARSLFNFELVDLT